MWKLLSFLVLTGTSLLVSAFGNDDLVGKGRWLLLNILQCDDPEQYEVPFEITRKKLNRTHDYFNLYANLDREINFTFGVELKAFKEVDGGFKFYQSLADENICNFGHKYAGGNWEQALSMANIDPPDCPIPPGEFKVDQFVMDYSKMEQNGIYGTFDVWAFVLYEGRQIGCTRWLVKFDREEEEDDDE